MTTLLKNLIHNGKNVRFWQADHIAIRTVAATIFKSLSDQISHGYLMPTVEWNAFTDAQAIWAVDDNDHVLGGICFTYDQDFFLIHILCVFENDNYDEYIHQQCLEHLKILGKQASMNGCFQIIHNEDIKNIHRASESNMVSTFHIFTRSLINDN